MAISERVLNTCSILMPVFTSNAVVVEEEDAVGLAKKV